MEGTYKEDRMSDKHWWEELDWWDMAELTRLQQLANAADREFSSIEEEYGETRRKINAIINREYGGKRPTVGEG